MNPEQLGYLILGLGTIIGFILGFKNLFDKPNEKLSDKQTEAYQELTKAINDLNTVVQVLTTKFDITDKLVEKLDKRMTMFEKRMTSFELNCAYQNHGNKKEEAQ